MGKLKETTSTTIRIETNVMNATKYSKTAL